MYAGVSISLKRSCQSAFSVILRHVVDLPFLEIEQVVRACLSETPCVESVFCRHPSSTYIDGLGLHLGPYCHGLNAMSQSSNQVYCKKVLLKKKEDYYLEERRIYIMA